MKIRLRLSGFSAIYEVDIYPFEPSIYQTGTVSFSLSVGKALSLCHAQVVAFWDGVLVNTTAILAGD
jgi:hypothetical protein